MKRSLSTALLRRIWVASTGSVITTACTRMHLSGLFSGLIPQPERLGVGTRCGVALPACFGINSIASRQHRIRDHHRLRMRAAVSPHPPATDRAVSLPQKQRLGQVIAVNYHCGHGLASVCNYGKHVY